MEICALPFRLFVVRMHKLIELEGSCVCVCVCCWCCHRNWICIVEFFCSKKSSIFCITESTTSESRIYRLYLSTTNQRTNEWITKENEQKQSWIIWFDISAVEQRTPTESRKLLVLYTEFLSFYFIFFLFFHLGRQLLLLVLLCTKGVDRCGCCLYRTWRRVSVSVWVRSHRKHWHVLFDENFVHRSFQHTRNVQTRIERISAWIRIVFARLMRQSHGHVTMIPNICSTIGTMHNEIIVLKQNSRKEISREKFMHNCTVCVGQWHFEESNRNISLKSSRQTGLVNHEEIPNNLRCLFASDKSIKTKCRLRRQKQ